MARKKKDEAQDLDELISIAEAARLRGVSHTAIGELLDRGRLPYQTIGGRRLIRRGDVINFKPEKGGRGRKAGS